TGLNSDGKPLQGHEHARILCETSGERGSITHITLHAPMGFKPAARRGLDKLRKVWGHGGHDLQLILLGVGLPADFTDAPFFAEATVWRSLTPFVSTRHAKAHRNGQPKLDEHGLQIGSPEHDLCRLIVEAALPRPSTIVRMTAGCFGRKPVRWLAFQRERKHGTGSHAGQMGYGFRLTFPKPVRGPLAFGYASHFGLGLFVPVEPTLQQSTTP
ncbi:MAG: type I-U CRISPR-associated protein Cas5/Cas6, partial [Verrucomicrobiae bacterium]|nr:type I-U CRISPR-associated protein Cas5/Cas6 [Verrucomicrobiae bacterium]